MGVGLQCPPSQRTPIFGSNIGGRHGQAFEKNSPGERREGDDDGERDERETREAHVKSDKRGTRERQKTQARHKREAHERPPLRRTHTTHVWGHS